MTKNIRQIIVDLPEGTSPNAHADLANAIWAIVPDGASISVVADDEEQVNQAMDDRWKGAPEYREGRWRAPRARRSPRNRE